MAALQQPTNDQLSSGGTPNPLDFRRARPVGGLFTPADVILNANTYTQIIPIAGALLVRLRGIMSGAGTLSFAYRRSPPNTGTAYGVAAGLQAPHTDVAVTGGTEFCVDINPGGESYLAVTFDPSADGVVTFLDQMQQ